MMLSVVCLTKCDVVRRDDIPFAVVEVLFVIRMSGDGVGGGQWSGQQHDCGDREHDYTAADAVAATSRRKLHVSLTICAQTCTV
jgi:hypothetical protein